MSSSAVFRANQRPAGAVLPAGILGSEAFLLRIQTLKLVDRIGVPEAVGIGSAKGYLNAAGTKV